MERVVFVEVLGRRGEVAHRVRLAQLPATVGRAWTNDVILADPHVDAQHARIALDEQGELVIEDLGSVNGVYADGTLVRARQLPLRGLATVRVGRTLLRVAAADQAVPPAVRDVVPSGRIARLTASGSAMAGVAVLGTALAALSIWLGDYEGKSARELAGDLVALVGVVLLWAGLWGLAGRLIAHRARFWAHGTLAWLFLIAIGLCDLVESYLDFLFPAQRVVSVVGWGTAMVLFVALITAHAGLASAAPRRRRLALGAALAGGLALLAWLGDKAAHGGLGESTVTISAGLKPLPASLVPATTVEEFVRRTAELKAAIDKVDE